MKKNLFRKKLELNKKTIVNLSDEEKSSINGGRVTQLPGTCFDSEMTCCTWWQECFTDFMSNCG